jgi:NAD(P)-dependent dehydrogenase (short-subunit alcohol dehydrogenase family)
MKILVTGGTGHLGRVVVEHLKTDGHRVRILARHPLDDSRQLPPLRYGTGPTVDPVAPRVRCLAARSACRRRTALGPGLLAAGPASKPVLLSIGSARASFRRWTGRQR